MLVNIIHTTITCETSITKQPSVKTINTSYHKIKVQGNHTLACLIVEVDWNCMGRVEVFPNIFKIVEGSK